MGFGEGINVKRLKGVQNFFTLPPVDFDAIKSQRRNICMVLFGMIVMKFTFIIIERCGSIHVERMLSRSTEVLFTLDSGNKSQTGRKPRIFCILLTTPANYEKRAIHAQNTWARRCTNWAFISTTKHAKLKLLGRCKQF